MIVTFVSQCQKNALDKTRMVLDTFASRIGDKTWQTVITNEGLNSVKRQLRKTASKNTAVACHWIRGHSRSELIWIVGNRNKFNQEGLVPVHTTKANIINTQWENDWHYMPLINALTALAALFHDWGKATLCFQEKLKSNKPLGDPLRHEWISCLLLHAFVHANSKIQSDEDWLFRLAQAEIDENQLKHNLSSIQKPLADLPPAASLIAWLILSHHRLPLPQEEQRKRFRGQRAEDFQTLFKLISADFGYENKYDLDDYHKRISACFEFPHGLLSASNPWLKQIKKWAQKLEHQLALVEQSINDGSWRLILHHCRLSLMLGDHYYSSQPKDQKWESESLIFANTDRSEPKNNEITLKQQLDEHLVGVAKNALRINHLLPAFENKLPAATDIRSLKKKSHGAFVWQDKAVEAIKAWRSHLPETINMEQTAFFTVNMASTGCGKTLANAKIMRVLSTDFNSLRYILALGLRTLTLQTGDEYRQRIGLDDTELGVLIGSKAMLELHQANQKTLEAQEAKDNEQSGSESLETLLDTEVSYSSEIPEERLSTLFSDRQDPSGKNKKFLYAPVLACTIDHIMAATETKRGGRYILPCLRLMSSDLVIDEIDDFDGSDLIAIGRLIHLAGMLGRKVMISSATIPPDLAEGYFNAYHEGWLLYSKSRKVSAKIGCAWIDEFKTQVETLGDEDAIHALKNYKTYHAEFIAKRVKKLSDPLKTPVRRIGEIIICEEIKAEKSDLSLENRYFEKIKQAIIEKHKIHHTIDLKTQKKVSFGVVRVANIAPCIALAAYLSQAEWEPEIEPRIMAYHSQQVLLLRSDQEKHLDQVLKRTESQGEQPQAFSHPIIRQHLDNHSAQNVIFIVVATPVEEIGRDHDFDWAVIEPSSFRSIIQLAGRVMRHRNRPIQQANITLMQYNLKAIQGKAEAYCHPGYEKPAGDQGGKFKLQTHDLEILLDGTGIETSINALPRIQKKETLQAKLRLADLEHETLHFLLTNYEKQGPEALQGWLTQCWWLTAVPQVLTPFRQNTSSLRLCRIWDDGMVTFKERDSNGEFQDAERTYNICSQPIRPDSSSRLWLKRDYESLLEEISETHKMSIKKASEKYGEINIPIYHKLASRYVYSDQFGLSKTKE
jgi:CRISPR-associated endonuclease/helicase Cas3